MSRMKSIMLTVSALILSCSMGWAQETKILAVGSYPSSLTMLTGDFSGYISGLALKDFSPGIAIQIGAKRVFGEFEYLHIKTETLKEVDYVDTYINQNTGEIITAEPGTHLITHSFTHKAVVHAISFSVNLNALKREHFSVYAGGGPSMNLLDSNRIWDDSVDPRVTAISPEIKPWHFERNNPRFGVGIKAGAGVLLYPVKFMAVGGWVGYMNGSACVKIHAGLRLKKGGK